jgi:radical SAM superfamily enzyme YgiQ (UPF0313 family)
MLAALVPPDWQVRLVDENVEEIEWDPLPDLAAVSVMTPLAPRGYAIADRFRRSGVPVVLGGIHPTMMPEEAAAHADSVVLGEAEGTWPQVLADARSGRLQPVYRAPGLVNLEGLAIPRRELLRRKAYFFINTTQTTRGCPFDCDFCSVTSFYGRSYRVRPVPEVLAEIERMERSFVFFVDDNIVGRPGYAKQLFRELAPLKIKWFSQAALSIVRDRELLDLARDSGCKGLFIGFESLSQKTLYAMGKSANRAAEYREAVRALHDEGIGIQGSFIFGSDHDDAAVFDDVLRFIEKTHLEAALFSILTPFPGTRIYTRMLEQNRIIDTDWGNYDMNHVVFQPRGMSPRMLQEGFNRAYRRLYGWRSIATRLFPFKRSPVFFAVQNIGFRQAWRKTFPHL